MAELERLGATDDDVLFYDFCSLPQWDDKDPEFLTYLSLRATGQDVGPLPDHHRAARTAEQEVYFRTNLEMMHYLYTWVDARVLVLPHVPATASHSRLYKDRGWTCFEIGISSLYGTILNDDSDEVLQVLNDLGLPKQNISEFAEEFSKKHFTQNGDAAAVIKMYADLHLDKTDPHFHAARRNRSGGP